ncbi:hypothetical protein J6590_073105 [Homalodisca vitripennis]|nr:hypothetical protein J6590_073105 [Homalodisca vitripennis]
MGGVTEIQPTTGGMLSVLGNHNGFTPARLRNVIKLLEHSALLQATRRYACALHTATPMVQKRTRGIRVKINPHKHGNVTSERAISSVHEHLGSKCHGFDIFFEPHSSLRGSILLGKASREDKGSFYSGGNSGLESLVSGSHARYIQWDVETLECGTAEQEDRIKHRFLLYFLNNASQGLFIKITSDRLAIYFGLFKVVIEDG